MGKKGRGGRRGNTGGSLLDHARAVYEELLAARGTNGNGRPAGRPAYVPPAPPPAGPSPEERKERKQEAGQLLGTVRLAAEGVGLTLAVSQMTGGATHWRFDNAQGRALDYWPSRGTWWCQRSGEKGKAATPWEALGVAVRCSQLPWR